MFKKVLVANRGEIAVRAFRAAYELGASTVAVFPYEDRNSEHRLKADEAYLIGDEGHPVRAYLNVDEIIRVAKESGADAVYPGYGFLAENPELARACDREGITFIGPRADVLQMAGNKVEAIAAAREAGVPTLDATPASTDLDELLEASEKMEFPLFVKAVAGGGGRGMRRVDNRTELVEAAKIAMREGEGAFGNPTVYIEQAVQRPRHIEVQVLADNDSNAVHLFERDCSIQRRHQKVVEIAPAPNLDPKIASEMHEAALKFARSIGYQNAGTVEFLLETAGPRAGKFAFIEMNPRIQVEHTVTEEITDVDLVQAQMRVAAGASLDELGLTQDKITHKGAAVQCRITTEDPGNSFRPDTGTITAYRSAGGAGVRLDGGTVYAGAEVSAHFDSMLVKCTARGATYDIAVNRQRRALAEFRIRGVATNIGFLRAVLNDPSFLRGDLSTNFIEERPHLLEARVGADRGSKILDYLADVTVNQPYGPSPVDLKPSAKLPTIEFDDEAPKSARNDLRELGPEAWAKALRDTPQLKVTDTSFRDAHQSLLATRVRTKDLESVAPYVGQMLPELLSVEAWGGATYDVALRFLAEDPWERLEKLRAAMPNINLQMLLRGRNTVGYTPYPTEVTDAFVDEAARTGIDIFRIFDALNDVEQMRPAIESVRETGTAVAEVALCYTSDLLDPKEEVYTLDYYLRLAEQIVEAGAHVLAIKDMAGLLRPAAATKLVTALRSEFDLPLHLHTHDTAGGQLATLLAASQAGVDAVDAASASMAGTTSQPPMSALVAALEHTERDTGLSLKNVQDLEPYWEAVRNVYKPFESGLPGPTGRVYRHEIPGGQLSNLRQQAVALGLGERFEEVELMYEAADKILGHLVKVTPSSKVVGDLALHLVAVNADPKEFAENPQSFDIPDSVIGFLSGDLGDPPAGWPEPFRTKALEGRKHKKPAEHLEEHEAELLREPGKTRQDTLNRLLFPQPTKEHARMLDSYGDLSVLETNEFLYGVGEGEEHAVTIEKGKSLLIGIQAVSSPDERGMRNVMATLNGQLRPLSVRDRSIEVDVAVAERADESNPGHVASPFAGVVTLQVSEGDKVKAGQTVATIEAMKMEASITATIDGTVSRVAIDPVAQLEGGDLVVVIDG